jgi:hypothetical protein
MRLLGVLERCYEESVEASSSLNVPDWDGGCTHRWDGHGGDVDEAKLSQDESENDRHGDGSVCGRCV